MDWDKIVPWLIGLFGAAPGAALILWLKGKFDGTEKERRLLSRIQAWKEVKDAPELEEPIRLQIRAMLGVQDRPIPEKMPRSERVARVQHHLANVNRGAGSLLLYTLAMLVIGAVVVIIGYVEGVSSYTHAFLGVAVTSVSLFALFALYIIRKLAAMLNDSVQDTEWAVEAAEKALSQAKQFAAYADLYGDYVESKGQVTELREFAKSWEPKPEEEDDSAEEPDST